MKYLILLGLFMLSMLELEAQQVMRVYYDSSYFNRYNRVESNTPFKDRMVLEIESDSSIFYSPMFVRKELLSDSLLKLNMGMYEILEVRAQQGITPRCITAFTLKNKKTGVFKEFEHDHVNYATQGALEVPVWDLMPEFKNLLGYRCQKAQTHFLGRLWEAWFTTEIPVSEGPWKLHGLPGLILEAKDVDGYFLFQCQGLETSSAEIQNYYQTQSYEFCSPNKFLDINRMRVEDEDTFYKNIVGNKVQIMSINPKQYFYISLELRPGERCANGELAK